MPDSLKTLSRIQKFNLDEQQKILFSHLEEEDKIIKKLLHLNKHFEEEKKITIDQPHNFNVQKDFASFLKKYMKDREDLQKELADIRQKIEEVRDIMADMFREQKTYDIVDENREKKKAKEEADKEQKMLDEIGTNAYIKRNKKQP